MVELEKKTLIALAELFENLAKHKSGGVIARDSPLVSEWVSVSSLKAWLDDEDRYPHEYLAIGEPITRSALIRKLREELE